MGEQVTGYVGVIIGNFANLIAALTIRAKDDIAFFNSLRDRPQSTTGQTSGNLALFWVTLKKDGNELVIKFAPVIRKTIFEILLNIKMRANEAMLKALLSVHTFLTQHNAVIAFHSSPSRFILKLF